MELKINFKILKPFFEKPRKSYLIREIAKEIKVNHTTVRQYLKYLENEGVLSKNKQELYPQYQIVQSKKYFNLKLYYNLEKLRTSNLIKDLQQAYDFPTIVLFGSYAQARDTSDSDVDICLITEIKKEFNTERYEKILNRKISLHKFNKKKLETMKLKNKELLNSILNGIVLDGELEII